MKIINTESGKPYQLFPDTEISIERTNPFFNEYGEQTLPVSLPDSSYNRNMLHSPGCIQKKDKVRLVDASIEDGNFHYACRQAVLSVIPEQSIETSFYFNEASFYSRLSDIYLADIFREEVVPGVRTVDQAIEWMRQLWQNGGNEQFACFRVVVDDDGERNILNAWDIRTGAHETFWGDNFYHAVDRVIRYKLEDKEAWLGGRRTLGNLFVPKGFYITPFIKVNYLLSRIFSHFGYTLQTNFFTRTGQFRQMVLLNNVADSIVLGSIRISQLLPHVTCKRFLEAFRKKFCCEFIVDESRRSVRLLTMNELLDNVSSIDLSRHLTGKLKVDLPESYRQIILKSEGSLSSEDNQSFKSLPLIRSRYPTVRFSAEKGIFYREGFACDDSWLPASPVIEVAADTSQPYYEGGNIETLSVSIPETVPLYKGGLYVGKCRYLNSSLHHMDKTTGEDIDSGKDYDSGKVEEQHDTDRMTDIMFAFVYRNGRYTGGTVTSYGSDGPAYRKETFTKIGDYSLVYNGEDGIFERFYRQYDSLLRNSLHHIETSFILPPLLKHNLKSTDKVHIKGLDCFIHSLKFAFGDKNQLVTARLLSLCEYEPKTHAKKLHEIIPPLLPTGYRWRPDISRKEITKDEYEKSPYKDVKISAVFPHVPRREDLGKKCFLSKTAIFIDAAHAPRPLHRDSWWIIEKWLEAVPE